MKKLFLLSILLFAVSVSAQAPNKLFAVRIDIRKQPARMDAMNHSERWADRGNPPARFLFVETTAMDDPNNNPFVNQTRFPLSESDKVPELKSKLIRPNDQTVFYFVAGLIHYPGDAIGHGTLICCADSDAQAIFAERMTHREGCNLSDHKHEVLTGVARYGRG